MSIAKTYQHHEGRDRAETVKRSQAVKKKNGTKDNDEAEVFAS